MSEDSSNDTSVVAITSDEETNSNSDKPIIKLFKRLIANDSKENTILTNNQILDLLKIEFGINIFVLHSLEVDIYITLMKKFLKDWPQWEDFDGTVNEAKKNNSTSAIDDMLQEKHDNLKNYLQTVLDFAKPLVKDTVTKAKEHQKKRKLSKYDKGGKEGNDGSEAVLEVDATRDQLNNLILRYPVVSSIFNYHNQEKTTIKVGQFKTESILNWWNVNIEVRIKPNSVLYKRSMAHEFKHRLLNKKLTYKIDPREVLDQDLKLKTWKQSRVTQSSLLINYIDKVAAKISSSDESLEVLRFIKKDLFLMPQKVYAMASYMRYLSEYSYVRYLFVEHERGLGKDKFDLQLEEVILPMVKFSIYGFDVEDPILDMNCVTVECTSCDEVFTGPNLMTELRLHFETHMMEKPWTCTNCGLEFPMLTLAEKWWCHECQNK